MSESNRWALLLVGVVLILFVLITSSHSILRQERIAQRQRQVQRDLELYSKAGLFRNSLVDDLRKQFVVPTSSISYSGGRSIGEVMADVSRLLPVEDEAIERRLSFEEFATHVGANFLAGTKFDGRIQVNKLPREGFVNLYFLENDPKGLARHFKHNCSYIGYQSAILCDAEFVSSYLRRLEGIRKNYDVLIFEFTSGNTQNFEVSHQGNLDRIRSLLQQNFLTWIIGHELGHAVLHEDKTLKQNSNAHFDLRYSETEKQADIFVAEGVIKNPALGNQFSILLAEFLEQEFRQLYHQQNPSKQLTDVEDNFLTVRDSINVEYSRYNVPLLLRAARIMKRLRELDPATISSGYMGKIGSHAVFVQSLSEGRTQSIEDRVNLHHPSHLPISGSYFISALALIGIATVALIIHLSKNAQEDT